MNSYERITLLFAVVIFALCPVIALAATQMTSAQWYNWTAEQNITDTAKLSFDDITNDTMVCDVMVDGRYYGCYVRNETLVYENPVKTYDITIEHPEYTDLINRVPSVHFNSSTIRVHKTDNVRVVNYDFRSNSQASNPIIRVDDWWAYAYDQIDNRGRDERREELPRITAYSRLPHYVINRSRYFSVFKQDAEYYIYHQKDLQRQKVAQAEWIVYMARFAANSKDLGGYYGVEMRNGRLSNETLLEVKT